MLVATLCALQILFVPPKKLWKVTNIESAKGDAADAPTM
jgi:hypothetical protein